MMLRGSGASAKLARGGPLVRSRFGIAKLIWKLSDRGTTARLPKNGTLRQGEALSQVRTSKEKVCNRAVPHLQQEFVPARTRSRKESHPCTHLSPGTTGLVETALQDDRPAACVTKKTSDDHHASLMLLCWLCFVNPTLQHCYKENIRSRVATIVCNHLAKLFQKIIASKKTNTSHVATIFCNHLAKLLQKIIASQAFNPNRL